jgi:hypothetical protein
MARGISLVLATCGGGGNDTAALVLMILALVAWGVGARAAICGGTEPSDRKFLLFIFVAATIFVPLVFLAPSGHFGDHYSGGRFLIAFLTPAAIGYWWAAQSGRASPGRALAVALVRAIFIPGGVFVLFLASFGIGTGCLE